ncbi:hypothetical protein [Nocardia stercoris]|nr:hypothetical protein [Nocardia stercoris]
MVSVRTVDVVPGELSARIQPGPAGPDGRPVTVVVSEGLRRHGQRELAFHFAPEPGEDPNATPDFVFWLLREVQREAAAGRSIGPGGRTVLRSPGWGLGITGFLYLDAPDLAPPAADGWAPLVVVPTLWDETAAVARFGAGRVLTMLGAATGVFPHPVALDRRRPPVLELNSHTATTMLSGLQTVSVPAVEAAANTAELRVTVAAAHAAALADTLRTPPPNSLALLTAPRHRTARLRYLFQPGGPALTIGERQPGDPLVAGNFVAYAANADTPSMAMLEDGFGVLMPPAEHTRLLSCLESQREFRCRTPQAEFVVAPR